MAATADYLRTSTTHWYIGTRKRQSIALTALVILVSLVLARLVLMFPVGAAAGLIAWIALMGVVFQPRFGVYLMLAIVLPFEGGERDNPLQAIGYFVYASPQSTLQWSGAILTPLEVLLLVACTAWLGQAAIRRQLDFRGGSLGVPMLLFSSVLVFAMARGLMGGADFNIVMWESRFLVAMVLCYLVAANTIRSIVHIKAVLALVVVAVGLGGLEAIWRKFVLADAGLLGSVREFWFSHEDVVMWALIIFIVLGRFAFGGSRWQQIVGLPLVFATAFAMLLSERRAGYIAVMIAFLAFSIVLFIARRKAFWTLCLPILLAGAIYLPLFWTNTGTFGQPARAVRSITDPDPRDASSNAFRDLEAINVRATIQSDPLLGIGFGRPFLQVVQVPNISFFEFWNLEAHHNVLWLWMKSGALGFITFFMVMLGGIARSAWIVKNFNEPDFRVVAMLTLCAIIMSLVFSYVDLGLTGSRIPMMLGILLGATAVVPHIRREELARATS